jgi:pSer/pThr/pTyr-binding forkhead associated (FHA) protein
MNAMSTTAKLTVKRAGALTEDTFVITSPAIIGRFDPSVGPIDVDLGGLPEGAYVSRKHAKLTEEEGIWTVTDLGSSNGTYILRSDFEKVDSAALADGDEFALGNARFVFNLPVDETPDQDEAPDSVNEDPAEDPEPATSE